MKLNFVMTTLGMLIAAGAASGCGEDNGTVQQNWTIQGTTNPTACSAGGAVQMRVIAIRASNGIAEATNFAPCSAFQTTLSLDPDTYTATATFLGENGLAVSQTKFIPSFVVSENQTTSLLVDFTLGDFLAR